MSADIQWLKSGTTNSNNFFFVSYLIGFYSIIAGQEQSTNPIDIFIPSSSVYLFLPEEVSSVSHKDKALRTHPPHKSLCSQRFLNTFAKIAAKLLKDKHNHANNL
jgi:hypothetical protein